MVPWRRWSIPRKGPLNRFLMDCAWNVVPLLELFRFLFDTFSIIRAPLFRAATLHCFGMLFTQYGSSFILFSQRSLCEKQGFADIVFIMQTFHEIELSFLSFLDLTELIFGIGLPTSRYWRLTLLSRSRPGADLGDTCGPKRSKTSISKIVHRFWTDVYRCWSTWDAF